jgi:HEAT repeat protein
MSPVVSDEVDDLIRSLKSGTPLVRERAAFDLGRIGDDRAVYALTYVASRDKKEDVRSASTEALAKIQ